MRHKAPSRWVVVNKVWLLAPQAKNRQSNHWRFPCALSELAPWRPQARHIDERQRYTKVPQTVGICFVWTVVQGRCFRHGFQFSESIDTHIEAHSHRQQCALWISSKANPNGNHNTVCAGWQWTILRVRGSSQPRGASPYIYNAVRIAIKIAPLLKNATSDPPKYR